MEKVGKTVEFRHKKDDLQQSDEILKNYMAGKVVVLSPIIVRIADGNLFAGIFLSNLFFWSHKSKNDGWVFKSRGQLESETCLNRRQQQTARKVLVKLNLLEEKRMGARGVLHFRLNTNLFLQKLKRDEGFDFLGAFNSKYHEGDKDGNSGIHDRTSTPQASRGKRGRVPARHFNQNR